MGRTMSEELERAARAFTKCYPALVGKDELRNALDGAFDELDAERGHSKKLAERVAELERERDAEVESSNMVLQKCAASQAENVRLRRFCDRCWDIARDGCDMDGAEIQESLVACGFLVGTKRTEACGENCRCVEYYGADEPWTCYEPATPAPVDALREVCEKVAAKAWDYGFIERGALEVAGAPALTQESHAAKRAADVGPIVSSILGPEVKP